MLTDEQAQQVRDVLTAQRQRILEKAESALGTAMARDQERVGRDSIDESVAEELYSLELRLHDREAQQLARIDAALARLEAGEIDECEDCDEPIAFRRLLARPTTTLCVPCKEDQEEAESMAASPGGSGRGTLLGGAGDQ